MSGRLMRTQILILMTVGALAGTLAFGQDSDPPGRAARLSYVSGSVSFQPGGVEDWVEATLNRPLTTGDRLWTESGARAELNIGSAAFRLNGRTNFAFLNLDDTTAQIQISLGTLSVRLRRLAEDETFEIDTPQAAFSLLRPGEYRIDVNEQGATTLVTVRGGEGEAPAASTLLNRPATSPATCPGTPISTITAPGAPIPTMARCGFRRECRSDGRLTASVIGLGSPRGVGPGWTTRRGATRPFTTAAGSS